MVFEQTVWSSLVSFDFQHHIDIWLSRGQKLSRHSISGFTLLLYSKVIISFLIGRFSKTAPVTPSYRRLYNNHVKVKQGHGQSRHVWPRCMISKGHHTKFARFVLLAFSEEQKIWLPGLLRWPSKTSKKKLNTRPHKVLKARRGWQRRCLVITNRIICHWIAYFYTFRNKSFFLALFWTIFFYVQCTTTATTTKKIRFGSWDIQNNQGLGKDYQPKPRAEADIPYLDLHHSGYHISLIQ